MIQNAPYLIDNNFKTIPFVEILLPYTKHFTNNADFELGTIVKDKLGHKLLEELSFVAEVALQKELDDFVEKGNIDFDDFIEKMAFSLAMDYPVLDKILRTKVDNFTNHIHNIIFRFQKDIDNIESTFNLSDIKIIDIDASLGDGHNGEGTSLVRLSDGSKLIYKPRNVGVTNSYNSLISWVNYKLKADLQIFKILDCEEYGWIEFVVYEEVTSEENLQEYYFKAGLLLAVTLLLGSKDCHHENVIASGKNPIMIDHETIIQPFFNNTKSFRYWDEQFKIPPFSVLESVLIVNKDTGAPLDIVGYGVRGNIEVTEFETKVINPNTINSKRTTRFNTRKIIDKNIPVFEGDNVFVNHCKEDFINGFSVAYDMFINSKDELRSVNSPLKLFKNNEVRYVWRPTFVYFKILKYMRGPAFMSSFEAYNSKLYGLLSKAFKGADTVEYKFILDYELQQMLKGDIPIFNLISQDHFLEGNTSLKIFEKNCMENIFHRIDLLSQEHKDEQLIYINRWLNM
jgi:type 2 lantibiotic biosynthesis protein LanM